MDSLKILIFRKVFDKRVFWRNVETIIVRSHCTIVKMLQILSSSPRAKPNGSRLKRFSIPSSRISSERVRVDGLSFALHLQQLSHTDQVEVLKFYQFMVQIEQRVMRAQCCSLAVFTCLKSISLQKICKYSFK